MNCKNRHHILFKEDHQRGPSGQAVSTARTRQFRKAPQEIDLGDFEVDLESMKGKILICFRLSVKITETNAWFWVKKSSCERMSAQKHASIQLLQPLKVMMFA
ncbi:hypothetical protein SADUNF_Sadunf17G0087900 [Salix dunnii]|uniref:Uncharacterized protein n=1 Tax=Salix dunnii TaxID=1413687 RepID=A0A835J7A1_9ROSI|nr:hypothetical protein SADUNF_Sadunf17G0087900 [Salix dunnii]